MTNLTGTREDPLQCFHYGDTDLWILQKNLEGTNARRVLRKIDLHFREGGGRLLVDLRRISLVDSAGAEALEKSLLHHPEVFTIGKPEDFNDLPLPVRSTLRLARPTDSLEEAITAGQTIPHPLSPEGERRRHHRIETRIAVEVFLDNISTAATLHDISLGGGRIGRLPHSWLRKISAGAKNLNLVIAGMEFDPLGKEIAGRHDRHTTVLSRPAYILPDDTGLGVQFDSRQ
jgi:hypothetical protein